jgi:deoxyribodipyrimidine photo-lyase
VRYVRRMTRSPAPRRALCWFRADLRLTDNPALTAAATAGEAVLVFIDETNPALRPRGGAARWWLHHSLAALAQSLAQKGQTLLILRGDSEQLIPTLARAIEADLVVWNRRYGAPERAADGAIKAALKADGIGADSFNGALLHEPMEIRSKAGGPMRVFTPFWRACQALRQPAAPLPAPGTLPPAPANATPSMLALPGVMTLDQLGLLPSRPDWAGGLRAEWQPGEAGAAARLTTFLAGALKGYAEARNRPDFVSTSRLSPHLAFGDISPRQVWHATEAARLAGIAAGDHRDIDVFYSELGWREFSHHLLFHYPDLATANYQAKFDAFPWQQDEPALRAWQRGRTGYPIVDAGMRELWQTGFMHNRVRMIVASFLIKHLMVDWRHGEAWFWDTLCDADPANNPASWQWVAGSGADAAPYFRIFNPVTQGEKFDPEGQYIRRFVPEIARLPTKFLHKPWEAPHPIRRAAGIQLGETYPSPIVQHEHARARALAAFQSIAREA